MVSLWDLITLLSGGAAFGGAIAAARLAGNGTVEISIAVILGSLVAVGCVAAVRTIGGRAIERLYPESTSRDSGARSETALRLIYLAAFVWIGFSCAVGMKVVAAAIEFAR